MFINISNQLPKTSYIKMMDVWLIFNLCLPFSEVLLHTYKVFIQIINSRFLIYFVTRIIFAGRSAKSTTMEGSGKLAKKVIMMKIMSLVS